MQTVSLSASVEDGVLCMALKTGGTLILFGNSTCFYPFSVLRKG